jgi:hypothetical protein
MKMAQMGIYVPEKAEQGENCCLFQDTAVRIKLNKKQVIVK